MARTLKYELEAIHYFAQAVRIKPVVLNGHSREEAGDVVQSLISQLPEHLPQPGPAGGLYDHEHRCAAFQIKQEQHQYLGYMDVVRALFMWVETPEEWMNRNRSLQMGSV